MMVPQIVDIVREPSTSLLTAIAKIGGLFALLRFAVILNIWHESLFVKEMNKNLVQDSIEEEPKAMISLNKTVNTSEDITLLPITD